MVHTQAVKSVWNRLHRVLLQTVGNKQTETRGRRAVFRRKRGKEKWSSQKDTEPFSLNFLKPFPAHTRTPLTLAVPTLT